MDVHPSLITPPPVLALELLDCAEIGLLGIDQDGTISLANVAATVMLDLPAGIATLAAASTLRPDDLKRLRCLVSGDLAGPIRIAGVNGATLAATRRLAACGTALISLTPAGLDDVGRSRDTLTGLSDRAHFNDRLAALCASGVPTALLMIDLDRFKLVNDSLGHQAGDALLVLVAKRLRTTFRTADIIGRLGGDEFAVAIPSGPDLAAIGHRIVDILSRPYLVERQSAVIGASVGIATAPAHATSPEALLRAADLALYQAKADGRGTVRIFDDRLDRQARSRGALADDLRRAIPLQQLELHFQPQICLATRSLTGFEALVRWPHPQHGLIPPDRFIPLAEEMGIIIPLGEWVMNEACRQAMTWPDHVGVAVNVSPKQLTDRERLPRLIATALATTGLPPSRLEIEITESALINENEALDILLAVRAMGVSVSMDDFGTGYSSLSQLRRFPFDKLKIDRSFVRDLGSDAEAAAVVRAIAALGRSLGMRTVAEGVETTDQESICREDGCSTMQGYLVSRPVPADQVAGLIASL